jgi:hypothetical protein
MWINFQPIFSVQQNFLGHDKATNFTTIGFKKVWATFAATPPAYQKIIYPYLTTIFKPSFEA